MLHNTKCVTVNKRFYNDKIKMLRKWNMHSKVCQLINHYFVGNNLVERGQYECDVMSGYHKELM